MSKTECKNCNHRTVCKYTERFSALQEEINKMLMEGEDALFTPIIVCRQHEGKLTITPKAGEHHD